MAMGEGRGAQELLLCLLSKLLEFIGWQISRIPSLKNISFKCIYFAVDNSFAIFEHTTASQLCIAGTLIHLLACGVQGNESTPKDSRFFVFSPPIALMSHHLYTVCS